MTRKSSRTRIFIALLVVSAPRCMRLKYCNQAAGTRQEHLRLPLRRRDRIVRTGAAWCSKLGNCSRTSPIIR